MLLWLTDYLSEFVSGFAVFQYLTFRTMVSVVTALLMSLLIGPVMIARAWRERKLAKPFATTARLRILERERPLWAAR